MTNAQVAEAFANGESEGHSNNMFIEKCGVGRVIYSYGHHFPIALIIGSACWFNKDGYSNTTAHHKGLVRRSLWGVTIDEVDTEYLTDQISKIDGKENTIKF